MIILLILTLPILPEGNLAPEFRRSAALALAVFRSSRIFSSRLMPKVAPAETIAEFLRKSLRFRFSNMV